MSLRAKLVLAFLLLAVAPLAAIVGVSYASSTRALRLAALEETTTLAAELSERMRAIEGRLEAQVRGLRHLPFQVLAARGDDELPLAALDSAEYRAALRELAPYVARLEFTPSAVAAVVAETTAARVAPPSPPAPAAPAAPAPPAAPAAPIVIDLQALMTEKAETLRILVEQKGLARSQLGELEGLAARIGEEAQRVAGDEVRVEIERARREVASGVEAARHEMAAAASEIEAGAAAGEAAGKLLRERYECPVERAGEEIGWLRAKVETKRVLLAALEETRRGEGEIPFAPAADGTVFTARAADREALAALDLGGEGAAAEPIGDWVVVKVDYPQSELRFGIAKPLRDSLRELRRTAGRNFGFGLGLIGVALIGVVPLSRRITRGLDELSSGARRLAAGELDVEVPVRSRDEIGRLAATFNRMARELRENQQRLVETELAQRLLASQNERQTAELEEARRFQLSLLPKTLPEHPRLDVAVYMRTATEVGGDYYDFHLDDGGELTVAIGDATGHGAKAGTMVTVIKSLFTADGGGCDLPEFLAGAAASIRRMELGRMAMALALARLDGRRMTVSSAGMPPVLVCRGDGEVEEIALQGLPLGGMAQVAYQRHETQLVPGDVVLLMSDGLPELLNAEGEPFGYGRVRQAVTACAGQGPHEIIAALSASAEGWTGGRAPGDDVTFVVLKVR